MHDDRHDSADDLLAELGRVAREESDPPAKWEAAAAGELGAEGRLALRGAYADDPALRDGVALLEPLGDDFDNALVDQIVGGTSAGDDGSPAPARPPDGVVPIESGRRRPWRVVAVVAAGLAAAILVAVGLGRPAALPAYQFEFVAGEKAVRGTEAPEAEVPILYPDSRIALTLRPVEPVEGEIGVAAFAQVGDAVRPFPSNVTCGGVGACKLDAIVGEALPDTEGPVTLVFVVGPRAALPKAEELSSLTEGPVRRFERAVRLRAAP